MRKKNRMKVLGLFLTGAMVFQFGIGGGCLRGIFNQAGIGFGRRVGELPADVVNDVFIAPLIDNLLGGGNGG